MIEIKNFKIICGGSNPQLIADRAVKNDKEEEKECGAKPQNSLKFHVQILKSSSIDEIQELSVSEFADQAGVTSQAVRKMIAEGRLQAKRIGNQYVIRKDELYRYLEK